MFQIYEFYTNDRSNNTNDSLGNYNINNSKTLCRLGLPNLIRILNENIAIILFLFGISVEKLMISRSI